MLLGIGFGSATEKRFGCARGGSGITGGLATLPAFGANCAIPSAATTGAAVVATGATKAPSPPTGTTPGATPVAAPDNRDAVEGIAPPIPAAVGMVAAIAVPAAVAAAAACAATAAAATCAAVVPAIAAAASASAAAIDPAAARKDIIGFLYTAKILDNCR